MGNGAVSHDSSAAKVSDELLDEAFNGSVQKKPSKSKDVNRSSETIITAEPTPQMSDSASVVSKPKEKEVKHKESTEQQSASVAGSKAKSKGGRKTVVEVELDVDEEVSDVSSDDMEPVDVLLQFLPFYGQGDPSNDSIVRSALSSLSVEDIDAKDEYGNTLLLLACQYRCEDLVRIMLNKGADPNAVNTAGASCLHFACYQDSSSLTIVKVLLQNGANPDVAESNYGCTPLHYCAGSGDLEFCKIILQYGAQINAYDYYNYTCVDYAREAGFNDTADYLQKRLDKTVVKTTNFTASTKFGGNGTIATAGVSKIASFRFESSYDDMSYWESHLDPDSGAKYYIHTKSGECLWESELKSRIQNHQQAQQSQLALANKEGHGNSMGSMKQMAAASAAAQDKDRVKISEAQLIAQATEARLIAFLTKHDPARLAEASELVAKHKGKEQELLNELCKQYKVQEDPEFKAFQDKLNELRVAVRVAHEKVTDVNQVDPLLLADIAQETRKNLESQFNEEKAAIKRRYEQTLEDEKGTYRSTIIEKEGAIAKLSAEMEAVMRQKSALEADLKALQGKVDMLHKSDDSAQSQLQQELTQLSDENAALKTQVHALSQELYMNKEKLASLEATMGKLTSGKEEMLAREQAASAERMEQQKQREAQYTAELNAVETKYKNIEMKLKSDLNQMKNETIRIEKMLREEIEQLKRTKDKEIESLRK